MTNIDTRTYARGTTLVQEYPFGLYRGGRALCPDGKVRALKRISATADTFFSVPAAVAVNGRTVSGFITVDEIDGEATVKFLPVAYGKNHDAFIQ